MQKIFPQMLLICVLLLCGLTQVAVAQEDSAVWQFYDLPDGSLFAEFPTVPRFSSPASEAAKTDSAKRGSLYKAYFNKTYYFVWSCPSSNCDVFEVIRKLKFRARNSPASRFSEVALTGEIIESTFSDTEGFFHRIRQFGGESRRFVVHSVSETAENADAERFVNSITATKPEGDVSDAERETFSKPLAIDGTAVELTPKNRPADGAAVKLGESNIPIVGVSFIAKPSAEYTDAARIYEISGEVSIRATFLASGSVSNLVAVKKLPFGLTDQALAAVQKVRFNPGFKDGKPVSVTRPISYSFVIQ